MSKDTSANFDVSKIFVKGPHDYIKFDDKYDEDVAEVIFTTIFE